MAVLEPPSVRAGIDALQGVWTTIAGPREARLLVAGNRFSFEFVGGDVFIGTLDLADGHLDMHVEAGPPEHVGVTTRCRLHLDGGVLRWCPGRPGSGRCPDAFPSVDDARYLSLVFRHARRASNHRPI
jgi:hypothetical protein